MLRLKRHQHHFTASTGEFVSSTIIPFGPSDREAISLASLEFLIGVEQDTARQNMWRSGYDVAERNGQAWVAVADAMNVFDLRTRT